MRWALAMLSFCVALPAMGAVAPEVSVEALARDADAVVRGTVTSATPRWAPDGRHIRTRVALRRISAWRGAPPAEIDVEVPGGAVGDVAQVVSGAPSFQSGEEVVVFLRTAGTGRWRVLGLALGKFRVEGGNAVPQLGGLRLERAPLRSSERRVEAMPVDELERRARGPVTALLAAGTGQIPTYERSSAGEGLCQYWPDPASPAVRRVLYEVGDPRATPACRSGGDPVEAIRSAFDAWSTASRADGSAPCTDMQLSFQGVTTGTATGADGRNRIAIRRGPCSGSHSVVPPGAPCIAAGTCADDLGCWDHDRLIALTTVTFRVSIGAILDADVEVNAGGGGDDDDEGFLVTCVDPPAPVCSEDLRTGCIGMDLRNTMTHEAGHFLGLSHSDLRASTMFARATQGETRKRVLSADAVEGMCGIYPSGGAVTTCGSHAEGCSTVGAKGTSLGLAALLLLLRRRPRQHTTTPA